MKKLTAAAAAATMIAGAALATAPAASAAGPRTTVDGWYADFLGRSAGEDPGSAYWVGQLQAGARPSDALWSITHSDEYNRDGIGLSYAFYLSREADAGARYWQEGVDAQAFPLEWVEQNVAASPEAVAAGNRRGDLIELWYYGVLGSGGEFRFPSDGEVAYWEGRVRAVGALQAFRELYYTPEAVTARITTWYEGLLGREPAAGEVEYWYPKEVESDINVGVLIASTPEYADLVD